MVEASDTVKLTETRPRDKTVNILMVDDQPTNLTALESVLAGLGADLIKANSGDEALRLLLKHDFAVVLLDVQMTGLDGFETAKLIRGRDRNRQTPIIFLTAFEDNRLSIAEAYALGAVDYLVKPLMPVILRAKVSNFIELWQKTEKVKAQAEQLRHMERREFTQKLAEENARLQQSEGRFRTLTSHAPVGIFQTDEQGNCLFVNECWCEITGMAAETANGQGWIRALHPDDRERVFGEWYTAVKTGKEFASEYRFKSPQGTITWLQASAVPLRNDNGDIGGYIGTATNITARRLAEEALREADRRKDEFLATLAHELRNPLAPIRNSLQILKQPGIDEAAANKSREMMERQVHHLVRLVDDLLDVSRVMRGKIELRKEQVDLASVIARGVETAEPLIDAQEHELIVALPTETLLLEADPVRLAQVVGNLLTNAAKYTEAGGRIWLTARRDGDDAFVSVRDTGIGIAPNMLPRIFELFVQVDHAATRSQGGLGIGLTLVRNLVEMHHGTVEARSDGLGKGSEFVVRLPLSVPVLSQLAEHGNGARAHDKPASSRRLMVVDDNKDAADSLALLLRLQGHKVLVAHDGPAALALAKDYRPEMMLLDIGMPGMDGYEVARRLRCEPKLAGLVLVALTGWGAQEDRRNSAEAGFDHHLVKPVEPDTLQTLMSLSARA